MITHNLFPTAVSIFEFGSKLTEIEESFIKKQETRLNGGNLTSVNDRLFDSAEIAEIARFCEESVQEYYKEIYAPKYDVKPYITQSWANYTSKGQWHHKHTHSNSFISGVFYVQAQKNIDKIFFLKDKYEQIKLSTDNYNVYNSESWWIGVETGQLVLFPSGLNHMVQTVETDETRISISFNTFLKGYIGDDLDLTGLYLGD
jgi:uncharacterized protein (TIGR02466 family)